MSDFSEKKKEPPAVATTAISLHPRARKIASYSKKGEKAVTVLTSERKRLQRRLLSTGRIPIVVGPDLTGSTAYYPTTLRRGHLEPSSNSTFCNCMAQTSERSTSGL